jgi:hypothetical protein
MIDGMKLESREFGMMEATQPRPMPIHVSFPRLKDNGILVNEQQVKTVMAQWVKVHQFPYVDLHINETVLARQVVPGHTIKVPAFMIVGYVSTTAEKVLPQTRDLAVRLCATFDSNEAHILFGAHREQARRPIPQQTVSDRAATEPSLPGEKLPHQQTLAGSDKPSPTDPKKLN